MPASEDSEESHAHNWSKLDADLWEPGLVHGTSTCREMVQDLSGDMFGKGQ